MEESEKEQFLGKDLTILPRTTWSLENVHHENFGLRKASTPDSNDIYSKIYLLSTIKQTSKLPMLHSLRATYICVCVFVLFLKK